LEFTVLNAVNIAVTAGSIVLSWTAAANAAYYNIYKAQPATGAVIPAGVNYGFIGTPPQPASLMETSSLIS
jgi:hypothetical protein